MTDCQHIHSAIREASKKPWEFGLPLEIDALPAFVSAIRHHPQYPAICIAAHIGTSNGVREEAKNCVLSYLEAELSRTEGELADADPSDKRAIQDRLEEYRRQYADSEHLSLSLLHLIGLWGFDALQTRGLRDRTYYRRLHRFREKLGRSVSIVCSDAHRAEGIFQYTEGENVFIPYTKLSGIYAAITPLALFSELRDKGLRFGETRTTQITPQDVSSWIQGVEIAADAQDVSDFWPFSTANMSGGDPAVDGTRRFTVQFSRNLNCAIGGRGSGKSALIEALAFVGQPEPFDDKTRQREADWYKRAHATLRGCRIRVCWRLFDRHQSELPRNALFLTRYFDPGGKHSPVTLSDLEGRELLPGSMNLPPIQIFRIHDIEEAALPERLRTLFDEICGSEVLTLAQQIGDILKALAVQRNEMVAVAAKIAALTKENNALRQYARRKQQYEAVNQPEIQDQYKAIDDASTAEKVATDIAQSWGDVRDQIDLPGSSERISSFFEEAEKSLRQSPEEDQAQNEIGISVEGNGHVEEPESAYKRYCDGVGQALDGTRTTDEQSTTARERIVAALNAVDKECAHVAAELQGAITGIGVIHTTARNELAAKGHPTGSSERQAKKLAFEAAEADLKKYIALWEQWDELAEKRRELFDSLKAACIRRTEIRKTTAEAITQKLATDLDPAILRIKADARPVSDYTEYESWLDENVRWYRAQHKEKRFELLARKITPEGLRDQLLSKTTHDYASLVVDRPTLAEGRITAEDAKAIIGCAAGIHRLEPEMKPEENEEIVKSLPKDIRDGVLTFPTKDGDPKGLLVDGVLKLDEVLLDDLPIILLNDRPSETDVMKPLEKLSPGQRCSAILPILLLNGTAPLVIDQPEDNLDNRLIRQVIVNVLSSIKLRRQVIVATHNPNLPVLGDSEQVIVLRAVEDEKCVLETEGIVDDESVVRSITEIMKGGREAFQYRHSIYQKHWVGGADMK